MHALFGEALKSLRPLVEEERKRVENERAEIESATTRKRLNALEKAALKFLEAFGEDEDSARDDTTRERGSHFLQRGYALSPPFAQLVIGQSIQCRLNVRQETFPEFEVGASVEVQCLTSDITASKMFAALEPHPNQERVLQARWTVKGVVATEATGFRVRAGPIVAESTLEVFASEAEKYAHISKLCISKKRYRIQSGKRKKVRVLAPLHLVREPKELIVTLTDSSFSLPGQRQSNPSSV